MGRKILHPRSHYSNKDGDEGGLSFSSASSERKGQGLRLLVVGMVVSHMTLS